MKKVFFLALSISLFFFGCKDDDDIMTISKEFTVTIENVIESKDFFTSGPITELLMPGSSESFSFNAGKGSFLKFGTMLVQSNDLFYGTEESGIALYDGDGNATTGDITEMIRLWDAGTEVNEEPGVGGNQAPRQSDPNTGMDENGTVQLISNVMDGFTYPATATIIKVTLTHDGGTMFVVTIENVSGGSSLSGPFAPGVWVIHSEGQKPMFAEGVAASAGLEKLAEDGDNSLMNMSISSKSGYVSPYAPGAYSIGTNDIFTSGSAASSALEALAEDGSPAGFANVFNTPTGAGGAGPIFPGDTYTFTFTAEDGDNLSFATMLIQSNDWFVGADEIELFANGTAISGDITSMLKLYDAGTETDEYAGAGNNQAPRQGGADTGTDENGNVAEENSAGSHVPDVTGLVKVTIN